MSKRAGCRPSALLGLADEYVAYCLDEAVLEFAGAVEEALSQVKEAKNPKVTEKRRQDVLDKWLGVNRKGTTGAKFRAPTPTK